MLHFECDYIRGAHPSVLEGVVRTNMEASPGYGLDDHCRRAERLILEECGIPEGRVCFLVGGTQTNACVIDALLHPHQGVVCAETGHINVHEAGAIEASGHKVLALPSGDGKIRASALKDCVERFYADATYEHCVFPGMVYISHPTEVGTLYGLDELEALGSECRRLGMPLFMDGARLVYGLAADGTDVSLKDIARICDVFYIGGTKAGTLFGEAVVVRVPELLPHFFTLVKRHGALLAKGRLLGVQFETLFSGGLYKEIGEHAVRMAIKLKEGFVSNGYRLCVDSPTNQQFIILPNEVMDKLACKAEFSVWGVRGQKETAVRFVTDWSTSEADVDSLLDSLRGCS